MILAAEMRRTHFFTYDIVIETTRFEGRDGPSTRAPL
jgi:hypothetical protein